LVGGLNKLEKDTRNKSKGDIILSIKELEKKFTDMLLYFSHQTRNVLLFFKLVIDELADYPKNLSQKRFSNIEKHFKDYFNFRRILTHEMDKTDDINEVLANLKVKHENNPIRTHDDLTHLLMNLLNDINSAEDVEKKKMQNDLIYTINAQTVVMLNSNLEGLLRETIKILQKINTELPEFTTKNIDARLRYLRKKCELKLKKLDFEKNLSLMGQYRHVIVHNNGTIDQDFVDNTPLTKKSIGKRVEITEQFILSFGWSMIELVHELRKIIFSKYFHDDSNLIKD